MPPRLLERVWQYFEQGGPLLGFPWPITYRLAEAERVQVLRDLGVRVFGALSYPHKPDMAASLNAWAVDFADRTTGALRCATFYPEPAAAGYVRAALDDGVQLFKAHVQVGGYDPRDPLLKPVWGDLADAGVPVVVHCGSGPQPGAYTGPDVFAEVLAEHPRLTAVVAHLGAPEYGQFLDLLDRYDRVHLDTTMAATDFFAELGAPLPPAAVPRLADHGDRIVLGSDFPNIPYPYAHQLEALTRLDLGDDFLRAVCWDNPRRLLGLSC
ncbi:MAG: amidohydrolase family protein [Streptosporangiales bacterium]|nr:amidohydrolase family protein [Streptosporangiales bacterium]